MDPSEIELRRFVGERIAASKVPSRITFVERIPKTSTGKPLRKQLANGLAPRPGSPTPVGLTPLEAMLAGIWCDLLQVSQVGPDDHFVADLGGDSLVATQVCARVSRALDVDVPAYVLLEHPTLSAFARAVGVARPKPAVLTRGVLRDGTGPAPASYAQEQLWLLAGLHPDSVAYNTSTAARMHGRIDVRALRHAWRLLVERHSILRTTLRATISGPVQIIQPRPQASLRVVDLQAEPTPTREATAIRLATAEAQRPFDLQVGPLARATLFCIAPDEHLVVVCAHHVVMDGWSVAILSSELAALYHAALEGTPSALEPLPMQFVDFAIWQRAHLQGPAGRELIEYWRNQLVGAPQLLNLALDRPRPALPGGSAGREPVTFDGELTTALQRLGQRDGATLFMVLLAVFQGVVWRQTHQHEFLVGAPVAGRPWVEAEGLIGCFANLLPMRADLRGDPTFRELLERVRRTTLGALSHSHLPFEMIVQALQPARDLSHPPLVQVTCGLDSFPSRTLRLAGVDARPVALETSAAKFDLGLMFQRDGDTGSLAGVLEYRTDLFTPATIRGLIADLRSVVERGCP